MAAVRTLSKELEKLDENPLDGISVGPNGDNMFEWLGTIDGPEGTPYEGGTFEFRIDIPKNYPKDDRGPQFTFLTKIFHPNVATNGHVCLLSSGKAKTITEALGYVPSLLAAPSAADPADFGANGVPEAVTVFNTDPEKFKKIASDWTKKYASD